MTQTPSDSTPRPNAAETTRHFQAAMRARDLDGLVATLSPGVVLRSPITARARFEGRDELRDLMSVVLTEISDITYVGEVGDDRERALFVRARVGREELEEAVWLRFDDGLIVELTLFVRPLSGLTALAAALAQRLAARRGRMRAAVAVAMTRPLAALTRAGDPLALRIAGVRRR